MGTLSSPFGAYIQPVAAAGSDGTLALTLTDKKYSTANVFSAPTNLYVSAPTASTLLKTSVDPAAGRPASLGAGQGHAIVGSIVVTTGAGLSGKASSYSYTQKVTATIIGSGPITTRFQFGYSTGFYDGNGGENCSCPQSPPSSSISGVSLDSFGNAVAVGQFAPGGVLQSSHLVAPAAPSAPRSVKAVAGKAKVTLSWTAPLSNNGSPVIGYDVYQGVISGKESTTSVNAKRLAPTVRSFVALRKLAGSRDFERAVIRI